MNKTKIYRKRDLTAQKEIDSIDKNDIVNNG